MARRKDQDARREQLRAAALRTLAEHGVAGTRLKDIATEAGVTSATVLYYYPAVEDLVLEVLRQAMARFYERRRQAVEGIPDARERLVATIRAGLPYGRDDTLARLAWETLPFELRNETVAAFDRVYVERQTDLYVTVLEIGVAQGHFRLDGADARTVATNLLALEDHHGLRVLLGWVAAPEDALAPIVAYASLATGCALPLAATASAEAALSLAQDIPED
ncbi:MAG TPA: TetR family transcriptional regulator [Conexibacter sp.]|nr:TetR family transcriptional regulator [Conexibacter sp.]